MNILAIDQELQALGLLALMNETRLRFYTHYLINSTFPKMVGWSKTRMSYIKISMLAFDPVVKMILSALIIKEKAVLLGMQIRKKLKPHNKLAGHSDDHLS